jgi:hypothetical protein
MAPPVFSPNPSLLNPKFDGYKLKLLEQEACIRTFSLPPPGVTQATVSARRIVPFTEVSARIKHNHLRNGLEGDDIAYIDKDGGVVLVKLNVSLWFGPLFGLAYYPSISCVPIDGIGGPSAVISYNL